MRTVLAAIDFSEGAKLVVAEAVALAHAVDGRLVLLHVIQPLPGTASEYGFAEATAKIARAALRNAARRLAHIQCQLLARKVTAATFHVTGIPGAAIVARAQELNASYIVIGSHGHGALYDWIVGSTASRVIKEATCPTVVVPWRAELSRDAASLELDPADASDEVESMSSLTRR